MDKNEESYLSHDDGGAPELFTTLKRDPAEQGLKSSMTILILQNIYFIFGDIVYEEAFAPCSGFTVSEAGFIRTNDCKVVCCDFSSDGKYLASAGHEKKVYLCLFCYLIWGFSFMFV